MPHPHDRTSQDPSRTWTQTQPSSRPTAPSYRGSTTSTGPVSTPSADTDPIGFALTLLAYGYLFSSPILSVVICWVLYRGFTWPGTGIHGSFMMEFVMPHFLSFLTILFLLVCVVPPVLFGLGILFIHLIDSFR